MLETEFMTVHSAGAVETVFLSCLSCKAMPSRISVHIKFLLKNGDVGYINTIRAERKIYKVDTALLFLCRVGLPVVLVDLVAVHSEPLAG